MIEITSRTGTAAARNIKIIGIGGAGANALDRLALDGVTPACLIAANTEAQALVASVAGEKIQLGLAATRGLGSGGDPDLGRCAAEEAAAEIRAALEGAEAVFVVAGLGGGTGSGAAPLVAELAREAGALVIAVVTLPFTFEGKRRAAQASDALAALNEHADAVICFENDRMGDSVPPRAGIQTAFAAADQTLSQSILSLAALLNRSGLIHLGFDDLVAVLPSMSARCLFGFGEAEGNNRSFDALARALKNPLMDKGRMLRDCETVLVQVSGGPDLTLDEVQLLMEEFNRYVNDHTRILFGAAVDPDLAGRVTVTIMSSVGIQTLAPRARVSRPERVAASAEIALEPEPVEAFALDATEPEAEAAEELAIAEPEPAAPPVEKPRGLRAATQQASLFGEEAPAPIERIAPPVPGRMLRRPFPERPAPVPVVEPEPEPEAVPEPEPEPEPPVAEVEIAPAIPEPKPEPRVEPRPIVAPRRPVIVTQPRSPELIPAGEGANSVPGKTPQQEVMEFEPVTRGRFEKSEPTIVDGQDLDVPTYLRRRVKLR